MHFLWYTISTRLAGETKDNFIENKKIALFVVNLVSKMYHLDDAVLVEFHPASRFPNPEVTAMVTRDYRILYNIDRLKVLLIMNCLLPAFMRCDIFINTVV